MRSSRFYRVCYCIARFFIGIFYRIDISGRENIPDGPAMICATHSALLDPLLIAVAFGRDFQIHVIAKAELFRIPVLSWMLRMLGMIRVNRGMSDMATIKSTLNYLKNGEKVAIFPEGTRTATDDSVSAKNGAVRIAERAGVPVVPFFIPRRKPLFHKIQVVIGIPYKIEKQNEKRTAEEYAELVDRLMEKIKALNPKARTEN